MKGSLRSSVDPFKLHDIRVCTGYDSLRSSVDPDKLLQSAASHQGLHWL